MKPLLRVLFLPLTIIRFVTTVIISVFFLVSVLIEYQISKKTGKYTFWSMRNWGKAIVFILGLRVKQNVRPAVDRYILMANHRGYLDIFLMAAVSPSAFVAKAEMRSWPIVGQALKAGHIITVKRNELKSLLKTMSMIKKSVENGIPVTIFPEGTTFRGPGTRHFKSGSFKIASELGVPILPCAISYGDRNDAWVNDETFLGHFFRQMWKPFSKVEIRFGEPLQNNDPMELKHHTQQVIETYLRSMEENNDN